MNFLKFVGQNVTNGGIQHQHSPTGDRLYSNYGKKNGNNLFYTAVSPTSISLLITCQFWLIYSQQNLILAIIINEIWMTIIIVIAIVKM